MRLISTKEIEKVLELDATKRYRYFINFVADKASIWGLYDNGWVSVEDDNKNLLFPIWPAEEYASLCSNNQWANASPKKIEIHEFLQDLDYMKQNNIRVAVFYTNKDKGISIKAEELQNDLMKELSKIE